MDVVKEQKSPRIQRIIAVLWPSFIMASIGTILFFSAFDPHSLIDCGDLPDISRLGVYTIGFFLLWAITLSSCLLTCYFQRPCHNTTHCGD